MDTDPEPVRQYMNYTSAAKWSLDALEEEHATVTDNVVTLERYRDYLQELIDNTSQKYNGRLTIMVDKWKENMVEWYGIMNTSKRYKPTTIYRVRLMADDGTVLRSCVRNGVENRAEVKQYLSEMQERYPGVQVEGSL